MKDTTWKQIASYLILLLLLLVRFSYAVLHLFYDNVLGSGKTSDPLKNWLLTVYGAMYFGGLILIIVAIAINRNDLQRLNIDGFYIILLIISLLLGIYAVPLNCLNALALAYLIYDA
jgi:hypothetical protein